MERQNNGLKNLSIALLFSVIGLSIGLIFGVRLGMTTVELTFKSELNNLNTKINKLDESQLLCVPPQALPFQFKESDLEKDSVKPPEKMPPITL